MRTTLSRSDPKTLKLKIIKNAGKDAGLYKLCGPSRTPVPTIYRLFQICADIAVTMYRRAGACSRHLNLHKPYFQFVNRSYDICSHHIGSRVRGAVAERSKNFKIEENKTHVEKPQIASDLMCGHAVTQVTQKLLN